MGFASSVGKGISRKKAGETKELQENGEKGAWSSRTPERFRYPWDFGSGSHT